MGAKCCVPEEAKGSELTVSSTAEKGVGEVGPALICQMSSGEKLATTTPALAYHEGPRPGKLDIVPTKAMSTQKDLSLAYCPGVAEPCVAIKSRPEAVYQYTNKGNMIACISNGTAVLGLGNIGALASKPVMEGKAVLFKHFAGVNCVDICIDCHDPEELVSVVRHLAPSFGGINLEDIKGPDCFYVEERLKTLMPIPVYHDDQHGTAIVCLAGLINAIEISKKSIKDVKIVCNGAGAAGVACMKLIQAYGARKENCLVYDTHGVIYKGRASGMNDFKEALASSVLTKGMTLEAACAGADVLIGVSKAGAFTEACLKALAPHPVIFAMANPEPETWPEAAKQVRPDCIIATGRLDYPNQINNIMCSPFLFRAALDCRASQIDEEMKMAAAMALAALAKEPVPESVRASMNGRHHEFGPEYVIPTPFDPRLIEVLPVAVAKAAASSGAARRPIRDYIAYAKTCAALVA